MYKLGIIRQVTQLTTFLVDTFRGYLAAICEYNVPIQRYVQIIHPQQLYDNNNIASCTWYVDLKRSTWKLNFFYYRTCPLSPELLCLEWELWELEPLLVFEELRECPPELVTWLAAEGVVLSWATFTSSSCSEWFWFDSDAASSFSKPLMDGMSANVRYIWLIVSGIIIIIIWYYELMQVCGTSSAKERVTNNRLKRVAVTRIKHATKVNYFVALKKIITFSLTSHAIKTKPRIFPIKTNNFND